LDGLIIVMFEYVYSDENMSDCKIINPGE